MSNPNKHSASSSLLGYLYQGYFALLQLLQAPDNSYVSIETQDDIELADQNNKSLLQLKHSLGSPPPLTVKNDGLWKTIDIWCKYSKDSEITRLMYVTSATVGENDKLKLVENSLCPVDSLEELADALETEAKRVLEEREFARKNNRKKLPHEVKYKGCQAFLTLESNQRHLLIGKVMVLSQAVNITNIKSEVELNLLLLPQKYRSLVSEKILEWWGLRVVRSLYDKSEERISCTEVKDKIVEIVQECKDDFLSDDYGEKEPDDLNMYSGSLMEKQITLVSGGKARVVRATKARWKAMKQRSAWLLNNISLAPKLAAFDRSLIQEWKDEFDVMKEDCEDLSNDKKCEKGLELLDWSHKKAPTSIPPIVERWNSAYLVRGSYQELADKGEVGWHPSYDSIS
ncbi:ABC-three component system protein [Pontibacter liquoris]|uniref:ABC-three component system protein n=1 Tax=Pontibacter liquoris TaxID=2905677 RepID=UPI001FA6CCF5|nr:ABC-three component system protein [Pontibacter liquoris]